MAVLAESHAEAVLRNPALALIAIEQPHFWATLSQTGRFQLASTPRCPPALAHWAIGQAPDGRVLDALSRNGALPLQLRRAAFLRWPDDAPGRRPDLPALKLARLTGGERALLAAARQGAALGESALEALALLGKLGQALVLRCPTCPVELLERLYDQRTVASASFALCHPRSPAARVDAVPRQPASPDFPFALRNPSPTAAQFDALSRVRGTLWWLVESPSFPASLVPAVLAQANPRLVDRLARNGALAPEARALLTASQPT